MSPEAKRQHLLAWAVMALLAVSTFLNYLDRQVLSLLAQPVQQMLSMDDRGYAFVVTAFMAAYTLGNLNAGYLIDRFGAVRAAPFFVGAWSIAGCLSGLAQNMPQLAASRFMLGLFEVGNFVAAPMLVALFMPARHKALGVGLYTAAAMFGAAVSPPLITTINAAMGWRAAFLMLGGAGLCWVALWWLLPLGSARAQDPGDEAASAQASGMTDLTQWRQAVCEPKVWAIGLGTMLSYPVWFFYLNWFPKYLTDERGLSTLEMGRRAWIVYLAAGLGCLAAGPVISLLARKGRHPVPARLLAMGGVAVLAPLGAINYFEPPVLISLALAAAVAFIHMIWQVTITSLPLELFSARSMGKVFAVAGIASGVGGIASTWLIGQLVGSVSYRPMFVVMAGAYTVALLVLLSLLGWRQSLRPLIQESHG
jgi:ACS family hexuronate transporter-like MFS transporter